MKEKMQKKTKEYQKTDRNERENAECTLLSGPPREGSRAEDCPAG